MVRSAFGFIGVAPFCPWMGIGISLDTLCFPAQSRSLSLGRFLRGTVNEVVIDTAAYLVVSCFVFVLFVCVIRKFLHVAKAFFFFCSHVFFFHAIWPNGFVLVYFVPSGLERQKIKKNHTFCGG